MTLRSKVEIPREVVGQFAMFMQARDAFDNGRDASGVIRPTWDEIGRPTQDAYLRDAMAYIDALVRLGFRPVEGARE